MKNHEFPFPQEIYGGRLKDVNGVKFTPRETEIIAFMSNGRSSKKTASFFSISPKTVENHTRNIMAKLGCNSRESIIDFIEKSGKFWIIKEYYLSLLILSEFESLLETIAPLKEKPPCLTLHCQSQGSALSLIPFIKDHLKLAEVKTSIKIHKTLKFLLSFKTGKNSSAYNLFILSTHQEASPDRTGFDWLDLNQHKNYYFLVFEILKRLFPPQNVELAMSSFEKKTESLYSFPNQKEAPFDLLKAPKTAENGPYGSIIQTIFKKRRRGSLALWIGIGLSGFLSLFFKYAGQEKNFETLQPQSQIKSSIRSNLDLPHEAVLLKREKILGWIEEKFKNQKEIQSVALIGIGGAGKTTLARQYARLQNAPIAWEINAETRESLMDSFELLAYALSTDEERQELKNLQDGNNSEEKEEKIIKWVKNRLILHKNWLIIYDNVLDFKSIRKYFPTDGNAWGKGQIIITTRNSQMQNNNHVDHVLPITELNDAQKLSLFIQIFTNHSNNVSFNPQQIEEAENFLTSIPSYPLDVTIAANYLKTTNGSYKKYLDYLKRCDTDFENMQKNVLEEVSEYNKTRYGVVTLSLKDLINVHKDFRELLLFVSLLDPQNIPRDLLSAYKNDVVLDKFIYHLKKYSLTINAAPAPAQENSLFSIHPSVQENSLIYLKNNLELEKNKQLLEPISHTLENYILETINKQEFNKINNLARHCKVFLNHTNLLTDEIKSSIGGELGNIYALSSDYMAAVQIIGESLSYINKHDRKNYERFARFSIYLGDVYREIGDYERAKNLTEESLRIYRMHFPENRKAIAGGLSHLGAVYRHIGDFIKSKRLLEESIKIYKERFLDDEVELAWTLVHLGNTCREIGDYQKGADLLEESLLIYKKDLSKNHSTIAWNLTQLGNIYREMGNYEKARILLEEGLAIYQKYFPHNHDRIAWSLTHLGDVYTYLGDYSKAQSSLEEALLIHEQYFSKKHAGIARTLMCLGNAYRELGNYEKAKDVLEESLLAHRRHFSENHVRMAPVFMNLGITHGKLGHYNEAKIFLKKSLATYQKNLGSHEIEIARVLRNLGCVHLAEGQLEQSEELMHKSLEIAKKDKHPDRYICRELLAEIYLKKSMQLNQSQRQILKKQAIEYLNQALEVAKACLANNSPHKIRLQSKIDQLRT